VLYLLVLLGVIGFVVVIVGLLLPTTYVARRQIVVNAPRDTVHGLVNDLERWRVWEPWTQKDPTVEMVCGEGSPTDQVGATQSWTDKNGGGRLTITRIDPDFGIAYDVQFAGKYDCTASIQHRAAGDAVEVIWELHGDTKMPVVGGFFAKLMPGMIEPMFADGLQRLKAAAEAESAEA